jgi:hypothetical protein
MQYGHTLNLLLTELAIHILIYVTTLFYQKNQNIQNGILVREKILVHWQKFPNHENFLLETRPNSDATIMFFYLY